MADFRYGGSVTCAVSSITRILEQMLQHQHVDLSIEQRRRVESLLQMATFLLDSLANSYSQSSSEKLTSLEKKIVLAASRVEDFIKSQIYSSYFARPINYSLTFSTQCLRRVKRGIYFIKKLVIKIEEEICHLQDLEAMNSSAAGSSLPASPKGKLTVVGSGEDLMEIKTQLVTSSSKELKIFSVVGMGGIGKTTLARQVYNDSSISYHFDIRAWVTVSQSYNLQKVLQVLLDSTISPADKMHGESRTEELKETLYKSLKGVRYLIVIDDVWDTMLWDVLKRVFPNDWNASRVLLTTRLENVAKYANSFPPHHMHFLSDDASWNLLRDKVFGGDCCPDQELEEIGKKISQNCQGLPLAIVVIGGLLSKATEKQHWKSIAEKTSSILFTDDEQCSKILSLSYDQLPTHLKQCFLYVGIFPEDYIIRVSRLVNLWVAEGLVEPMESKSLEDVAYEYLLDLVDRSLILNDTLSSNSCRIKICKIHDVVRDFCTRKAKNEMFYHITDESLHDIPSGKCLHRISMRKNEENIFPRDIKKLSSVGVRSLFCFDYGLQDVALDVDPLKLRVLSGALPFYLTKTKFFSLRHFEQPRIPAYSSLSDLFPNLETIIVTCDELVKEVKIWDMANLRHLKFPKGVSLSDPTEGKIFFTVLDNLQTLLVIQNFKCSEAVLARVPNLKKLSIEYSFPESNWQYYCLNNVVYLHKLESLKCNFRVGTFPSSIWHNTTIPPSLKKLHLLGGLQPWEDMVFIGMLPNLEVLKIRRRSFVGQEWKPTEGQFLELKYLLLEHLELQQWTADSVHFPALQHLKIRECPYLEEIPSGMGHITTLQSIKVIYCAKSLVASAKRIQEEQLEFGNDSFQLQVNFGAASRQ